MRRFANAAGVVSGVVGLCLALVLVSGVGTAAVSDLSEAVVEGAAQVAISGSRSCPTGTLLVAVTNVRDTELDSGLPSGTVLTPESSRYPRMVVHRITGAMTARGNLEPATSIMVAGRQTKGFVVEVYALDFGKNPPPPAVAFQLGPWDAQVGAVLEAAERSGLSRAAKQAAVWIHCAGVDGTAVRVQTPMSDEELDQAARLVVPVDAPAEAGDVSQSVPSETAAAAPVVGPVVQDTASTQGAAAATAQAPSDAAPSVSEAGLATPTAELGPTTPGTTSAAQQGCALKEGTPVFVQTTIEVMSGKAATGTEIQFTVCRDVLGPGREVLIPYGAIAKGKVTRSEKCGRGGRPGKLELVIESVVASDGNTIDLRGRDARTGQSKRTESAVGGALFGILGAASVRGEEAVYEPGSEFIAFVASDKLVKAASVRSGEMMGQPPFAFRLELPAGAKVQERGALPVAVLPDRPLAARSVRVLVDGAERVSRPWDRADRKPIEVPLRGIGIGKHGLVVELTFDKDTVVREAAEFEILSTDARR